MVIHTSDRRKQTIKEKKRNVNALHSDGDQRLRGSIRGIVEAGSDEMMGENTIRMSMVTGSFQGRLRPGHFRDGLLIRYILNTCWRTLPSDVHTLNSACQDCIGHGSHNIIREGQRWKSYVYTSNRPGKWKSPCSSSLRMERISTWCWQNNNNYVL